MSSLVCLKYTKKPIAGRCFASLLLGVTMLGAALSVQAEELVDFEVISEEEALERALQRPELTGQWEAQLASAEAGVLTAGAFSNPWIGFEREQLFGDPQSSENTLVVEQLFPLGGRRRLQRDAARLEADATEYLVHTESAELAREVLQSFYQVLGLQVIIEAHNESLVRIEESLERMVRLVERGESSRYELERMRREKADITADLATARAELDNQRSLLAGWVGQESGQALYASGGLLPGAIPTDEEVVSAMGGHARLVAADRQIEALALEQKVAARWWVPDLMLRAGMKTESGETRNLGYVAGAGLSIPIFYRGRGEELAAQADLAAATERRVLSEEILTARALGLARQARGLREAALEYQREGVDRARDILELTAQSYAGGEAGILELLDAHRGVLEAQLREVELAGHCRQKVVELRSLLDQGVFRGGK